MKKLFVWILISVIFYLLLTFLGAKTKINVPTPNPTTGEVEMVTYHLWEWVAVRFGNVTHTGQIVGFVREMIKLVLSGGGGAVSVHRSLIRKWIEEADGPYPQKGKKKRKHR